MDYGIFFALAIGILALLYFAIIYFSRFKLIGEPDPAQGNRETNDSWQIYYFYSPHCGACKSMTPFIERQTDLHRQVNAIDISINQEMARRFNVRATPTVVFVENNTVSDVQLGSTALQLIENFIKQHGH